MLKESHLDTIIRSLGERIRSRKSNLTPAIGIVGDVSRLLQRGSDDEIRSTHSALAYLREQLEYDEGVPSRPSRALQGPNGHIFLAGALWAVSEMFAGRFSEAERLRSSMSVATRRATLTDLAATALLRHGTVCASDCVNSPDGKALRARPDELSRIFSTLLEQGLVAVADATAHQDRRRRYFAITELGRTTLTERIGETAA